MGSQTAAGSKLAITAAVPATQDANGAAALSYITVGQVEQLGTFGSTTEVVNFQPLDGPLQKYKGPSNSGAIQPQLAHDDEDAGQTLLRTAADDKSSKLYWFRVTLPNGARRFFGGRVFGYPETVGAANSMVTAQPSIEISTDVIKVAPSATPTPTPTPTPSLSKPSISPTSGNVGQTFTATDGTVTNGTLTSRRWLLGTTAIGTGTTITPNAAGSLVLENTATGTNGAVITSTSNAVTVSAVAATPAPSLSLSSAVTQAEGNSGTASFVWTLTLNRDGSTAAYPFNWAVTGSGSNPADAADFGGTLPSGSGTFAAGETVKTITVLVAGDTAVEPNDTFALTVTASGLTTVSSTGTISNDDVAPVPAPSLALSNAVTQAEGNSGTTAFAWTLTLNRDGSTAAYPFNWAVTGSGSNPADANDFGGTFPSGSGTFAAGETSKTITVLVAGDTAVEPNDTFTLTVTASGLTTVTSTGTISNDDVASNTTARTAQMANNTSFPFYQAQSAAQAQSRTEHYNRSGADQKIISISLPNCLAGYNTVGNALTFKASIEYPAGTFTPLTFGGLGSRVGVDGGIVTSDFVTLATAIPDNAVFWVRVYVTAPSSLIPYTVNPGSINDRFTYGTTVSDQTAGGTVVNTDANPFGTSGGRFLYPVAIRGRAVIKPAILIYGDSRDAGNFDIPDVSGDNGRIARQIGASLPYVKMAIPGAGLSFIGSQSSAFVAVANIAGFTHAICADGINDLANSGTDASLRSAVNGSSNSFTSIFAMVPKKYLCTIEPFSSSSNGYNSPNDQTSRGQCVVGSGSDPRKTHNDWRRTVPTGFDGCFEVADVMETSRNSGAWYVDANGGYSIDGLHANPAGYQRLKSSGSVPVSAFVMPAVTYATPRNLTMASGTVYDTSTPKRGTAALVPGSSSFGTQAAGVQPPVVQMTIEFWFKSSNGDAGFKVAAGQNQNVYVGTNYGKLAAQIGDGSNSFSFVADPTVITDGTWRHAAFVFGPSGTRAYCDGVKVYETPKVWALSGPKLTNVMTFGNFIGGYTFDGTLDEMAIWNTERYTANFTPPAAPYVGNEQGLWNLYHFDGTGTDSVGTTA